MNAIIWIRQGKQSPGAGLANISGAMMIQGLCPTQLGLFSRRGFLTTIWLSPAW